MSESKSLALTTAHLAHWLVYIGDLEFGQDAFEFGRSMVAHISHRSSLGELRILTQILDPEVVAIDHATLIITLIASEDAKQRSLSRTILCDETHTVSLADAERDLLEQHKIAKRLGETIDLQI